MNRERAAQVVDVLKFLAEGGSTDDIEEKHLDGKWSNFAEPWMLDSPDYTYRIKRVAREFILELNPNGTVRHTVVKGDEPWFDDCVHIKVREVL